MCLLSSLIAMEAALFATTPRIITSPFVSPSNSRRRSWLPIAAAAAALHSSPSIPRSSIESRFPTTLAAVRPNLNSRRDLCMVSKSGSDFSVADDSIPKGADSFLRSVMLGMEKIYLNRNSTAKAILELVHSHDNNRICYDHFAFRTFRIDGHGIDSIAKFFLDFGYTQCDELRFPTKKLKALWFAPPDIRCGKTGSGIDGPLPQIFISELLVGQLSTQSQEVIKKYVKTSSNGYRHAGLASTLGCLTWEKPSYSDYLLLSRESEYAAWTLVNGYALNHLTISVHRLKSHIRNIKNLNQFIEDNGFKLNSEGGILKVSPDGLLLQSSTVADSMPFSFADGVTQSVPCSYIEFAERLKLPQYVDIPDEQIEEFQRRDGFEVGNADKIFESTSKEQLTRKAT